MNALIALGLIGCNKPQPAAPPPPADAVAMVGTQPILQVELDHARSLNPAKSAAAVLEEIAAEEALAQLAGAEGLTNDPSVKAAIRRLLASRIKEKHLTPHQPTDDEIAEALANQQAAAPPPKSERRLAILRILFDTAGSEEKAVNQLKDAMARYGPDNSPGFGALAANASDHTDTRYQGGDAGWIAEGETHPLLPAAVNQAAADLTNTRQPSDVIVANGAAWIVMFWDTRQAAAPRAPTKAAVAALLRQQHEQANAAELITQSKQRYPVTILRPQDASTPQAPPVPATPPTPNQSTPARPGSLEKPVTRTRAAPSAAPGS